MSFLYVCYSLGWRHVLLVTLSLQALNQPTSAVTGTRRVGRVRAGTGTGTRNPAEVEDTRGYC